MPPGEKRELHQRYHDTRYGFPAEDDDELFGRLLMEINQAGLSWETVLRKEAGLRRAYADFDVVQVASFAEADRQRLLADPAIIRNKLKIDAAIVNAQAILRIQKEYGSFHAWIQHHDPRSKDAWVDLFKKHFKFVGGEIVGEFLMSIGILPGAHDADCPIAQQLTIA